MAIANTQTTQAKVKKMKHEDIVAYAEAKMAEHGLSQEGWTFSFHNKKRASGTCSYVNQKIQYSNYYVHRADDRVKDTILHEIAHALTPGAKHGLLWKQKCIEIGADPTRTFNDCAPPKPNYRLVCFTEGCKNQGETLDSRYRLTKKVYRLQCRACKTKVTVVKA